MKKIIAISFIFTLLAVSCDNPFIVDILPDKEDGEISYTVTFNKNGGDTEASPSVKKVTPPATTIDTLPAPPKRQGYTFEGWKDWNGDIFNENTQVTKDIIVYAQWKQDGGQVGPYNPADDIKINTSNLTSNHGSSAYDWQFHNLTFPEGFNFTPFDSFTVKAKFYNSSNAEISSTTGLGQIRFAIGSETQMGDTHSDWIGAVFYNLNVDGRTFETPNPNGGTIRATDLSGFTQIPTRIGVANSDGNVRKIEITDIIFHLPVTSATISPASANFNLYTSHADYKDIPVTVNYNGNTLTAIQLGGAAIATANYVESGNTVTIKKEYLASLGLGDHRFNFIFNKGDSKVIDIIIRDGTPSGDISPETADFNKKPGVQADIPVTVTYNGYSLTAIKNDTYTLVQGTDYTGVPGDAIITLKKEYLLTLDEGHTTITFVFNQGQKGITINVMDTTKSVMIDFEDDTTGKTYVSTKTNSGDSGANIRVVDDPEKAGEKSLRITTTNWNQGAIIPVNLPFALENYGELTFRYRANASTNPVSANPFMVYAAGTADAFTVGRFGNLDGHGEGHILNLNIVETRDITLDSVTWTYYTFDIEFPSPDSSNIKNLNGDIFIAIGINRSADTQTLDYLLDDIYFTPKDGHNPPASVTVANPASASFAVNGAENDITVNMKLYGNTLISITGGDPAIGSNYTDNGDTVTIPVSYLNTLTAGTHTLTFTFSGGTPDTRTITITVRDGSLITSYDFSTDPGAGSYWGSGLSNIAWASAPTGSIPNQGGVLTFVTTNTGNYSATAYLKFDLGEGNLGQYSKIRIQIACSSGGYKNVKIVAADIEGNNVTEISGEQNNFVEGQNNWVDKTITFTGSLSGFTGAFRIGVRIAENAADTYNIKIIALE
jgi:uncharacterized repeat protein (TIGR02543 family)